MNLTDRPRLRLFTLCALYVAQGLPFGFVTVGLRDFLHARGVEEAATGAMIAMVGIPWTFKFIWGPIIDRWQFRTMGRRRPWLLLAQSIMVIIIVSIGFNPGLVSDLTTLGICILVLNIFIALQDVCTDSLAVDLVPENQRGRANGFMYGSSYLGSSLGAAGIGQLLPNSEGGGSIAVAFFTLAAVVFIIMQLPLFLRERPGEKLLPWTSGSDQTGPGEHSLHSFGELCQTLGKAFHRKVAIYAAFFALLVYIASTMLSVVGSGFFVKEIGWKAADYSAMQGFSMWFSFGGSAVAGILVDRIGIKRGILLSGSLLAFVWIAFRFLGDFYDDKTFVTTWTCLQSVLIGFLAASMFSLFMNIADKRVAATQFTSYMALLNVSIVVGGKATGWAVKTVPSAPQIFLYAGIFQLCVMIFLALTVKMEKRQTVEA